jgi:hypothetical protein
MWALKVTRSTIAATRREFGEDGSPFAEREIGPDGDGGSFLALGDDLDQQFRALGVDLDVAELIEDQEVEAGVEGDDAGQGALVGGFDEFVDELGGRDVADPAALLAGGEPEADEQVGLAGAGVAEQDDRLAGVQVSVGGETPRW